MTSQLSTVNLGSAEASVAQAVSGLTRQASPDVTALEAAMATVITANVDSHDLTRNVEVMIYFLKRCIS